jgi:hypothetical protein
MNPMAAACPKPPTSKHLFEPSVEVKSGDKTPALSHSIKVESSWRSCPDPCFVFCRHGSFSDQKNLLGCCCSLFLHVFY